MADQPTGPALAANYGLEVRYVLRAFTRALTTIAGSFELTAAEFRLLRTLDEGRAATQAELAALAAMDRPYVSSLVKKMIARGLLATGSVTQDRRRVSIVMTEQGRRIFGALSHEIDMVNATAIDGIPAAELQAAMAVLDRMRRNLDVFAPESEGEPR